MAKKKRTYRRKTTIPMAAVGGAVAGFFIPPGGGAGKSSFELLMEGSIEGALKHLLWNYTGYNPYTGQWNIWDARGLHAAIIGVVAHKVASWLGINRALGRAKIPLLRI